MPSLRGVGAVECLGVQALSSTTWWFAACALVVATSARCIAASTSGGTSDGRFIAPICPQVIELGPPNASIHKVDEHIALADIAPLSAIYRRILELLEDGPER